MSAALETTLEWPRFCYTGKLILLRFKILLDFIIFYQGEISRNMVLNGCDSNDIYYVKDYCLFTYNKNSVAVFRMISLNNLKKICSNV